MFDREQRSAELGCQIDNFFSLFFFFFYPVEMPYIFLVSFNFSLKYLDNFLRYQLVHNLLVNITTSKHVHGIII